MKQQSENKRTFWQKSRLIGILLSASLVAIWACSDKDEPSAGGTSNPPLVDFDYTIDAENTLMVTFENKTIGGATYAWDFGDGKGTSSEENATYTYDAAGDYTVKLTSENANGVSAKLEKSLTVVAPGTETLIAGTGEKKWKLYRECYSILIGPDDTDKGGYLKLINDGSRECLYEQEWIFKANGEVEFKDNDGFWGEYGPFGTSADEHENFDKCFIPSPATMKNADGEDVSAWGSGTYNYTYDEATGQLELTGLGVWMVIPKVVGTVEEEGGMIESNVPVDRVTPTSCVIEEHDGYDLMRVVFDDGTYNEALYVSYDNWDDEPALNIATEEGTADCTIQEVTKTPEEICAEKEAGAKDGEAGDLEDKVLTEFYNTFETESTNADLVYSPTSATITYGETDPAGGATGVGKYVRGTEDQYSDAKFNTAFDFSLENFSKVSIEVYVPSSNVFEEGGLVNGIEIFLADGSEDSQFWTTKEAYITEMTETDTWVTVSFDLTDCAKSRKDFDMVGLVFGGGGHTVDGTFYIRNFKFE
ncbi:PKD domain-containing protein [Flammeovirga aprica]|uniref:PKD domain-containing protein n=1 Tax=Flammeovirga aprica JL-4 TaxID=694437 RepID=A0A7X9P1C1_9BACT|nr:PKD domain-containing protein [Flammeovirga aprica]NME67423.1 PKD domain-containing protein [Flammeovirga aprica JL-4]